LWIHLLLHPLGHYPTSDFKDFIGWFILPGYIQKACTMASLSLCLFPTVQNQLPPTITIDFAKVNPNSNEFFWNCCINALLFHGKDQKIDPHAG
jgi:hypothetical protein